MKRLGLGISAGASRRDRPQDTLARRTIRALAFALILFVSWSIALVFFHSPARVSVVVGEPSPRDIKALHQLSYTSEVRTRLARQAAVSRVADIYSGPNMQIASQQLSTLSQITDYITVIRYDEFSDADRKIVLLREIPSFNLSDQSLNYLVEMGQDEWQNVTAESERVLDLVLREEIRSSQVGLIQREARRFISYTLSDRQQTLVLEIVQSMVVPNSFYDAQQTEASRGAASQAIQPVQSTILAGESILREGELVDELALEKLQVLGMLDARMPWQERVGLLLLAFVLVAALGLYIAHHQPLLLGRPRRELLLVLLLIIAGVGSRILVPGHTLMPYLFPSAAIAMIVTILLDVQLAMVVSALLAVLVGFSAGSSLEMVVYVLMGSMIGGLSLWRMDHLGHFITAGIYVALTNMIVILAFRLQGQSYDPVGLLQLLGMGALNGVLSSSLTFIAFSFVGRVFGITTSLQLLELARPTHPLFRQLLLKAPGTYYHSILVSNLAESAAEIVGADALLARVGSYYHDIGKTSRPYFFAENQTGEENPHDRLDPKTSAEIVIGHVPDGVAMATRGGIPDKIVDFITEHHGTNLATYFFRQASQSNNGNPIREEDFRYPGPRPQSRETAIVMLADSVEAAVRANRPASQAEMERVIRQIINDRLVGGQLDESDLTLRDLDKIREAFIGILQGVFHPRIQYPDKVMRRKSKEGDASP
jgi:putative nucleotidyltransferase with HDIG domain